MDEKNPDNLPLGAGVVPTNQDLSSGPAIPGSPQPGAQRSILDQIDKDELSVYILNKLRDDIQDKEEMTWKDKRTYDINSYYGIKPPANFPWVNACNFPVPLTSTLLDTAQSNLLGSIFADPQDVVEVDGIAPEDVKKAKDLKNLLNWQLYAEIDTYSLMDKAIFRSLLTGTGIVKVIQNLFDNKVLLESIAIEDIYLPLNAKGFQINETDHVFQIVGLTENDKEERKGLGIYDGLDDIPKGFSVRQGSLSDITTLVRDTASGTKMDQLNRRDLYFIMECYLTYYWKPQDADPDRPKVPVELIVWIAPNGGKVLRMVENKHQKRPFVAFIPYPRDDRFWGESLPEKIRPIQEELDYAHNQNINAADIAILPPGFFREGSSFDPEVHKRVPGGMYPVTEPKDVNFPTIQVNPIFERQEDRYWDLAERKTGLTELFQGRSPAGKQTATLTVRRENRSEIRFKTVYQRYENAWDKLVDLIYFYDTVYFDQLKDKFIKVVGVTEQFKRARDLFPEGLTGNYNFKFSGSPLTEKEYRKNNRIQLAEFLVSSPLVMSDPANIWRVSKMYAEALGEKDFEVIVTKPREVNIASPEEAIQRIMGGELDYVPDPGIDADNYLLRLQMFFKTDTFQASDQKVKAAFILLFARVQKIREGQMMAMIDAQIIKRGDPAMQQTGQGGPDGGNGKGGQAQNLPAPA